MSESEMVKSGRSGLGNGTREHEMDTEKWIVLFRVQSSRVEPRE